MSDLSAEAQVMAFMFGGIMPMDKMQFDRPWAIHSRARKGLDELVDAGLLTVEPLNHYKDCPLIWKPTDAMKDHKHCSREFLEANSFPMTIPEASHE